jgi:hypothetical protein
MRLAIREFEGREEADGFVEGRLQGDLWRDNPGGYFSFFRGGILLPPNPWQYSTAHPAVAGERDGSSVSFYSIFVYRSRK